MIPVLLLSLIFTLQSMETRMPTKSDQLPRSRAEMTNYTETSTYDDVLKFIASLQKLSGNVRVENFGKTEEGRELPLMILSDPPVSDPRELRGNNKPVVFVMANIHAGEVEGKEAMQHLSRRLTLGDLRPILRTMVILIAPIYNADGNERIDVRQRTAQNGPVGGVGTRENAKGLDLNRDYMKLESVEARALVGLFNRWDPHLTVDLHTSNGSYHGYHLTYSPTLNPNADARLIAYERRMLPAIGKTLLRNHRFRSYYYGNYATKERLNRESENFELQRSGRAAEPAENPETRVWRTFDHRPMFGNNYVGLRNRLTILSEAYSYLEFQKRVAVTEAFVEEILRYTSLRGAQITGLIERVDSEVIRGKARSQGVDFEITPLAKPVPILVGEVKKVRNPRSGKDMTLMIEDKATPTMMPDYGVFTATRSRTLPGGYIFTPEDGLKSMIDNLSQHGILMEELIEPLTIEVEKFSIGSVTKAARVFQGHQEIRLRGTVATESRTLPAGSIVIRTAQPKAALIFYLLEAESDSGYVRWNFLDSYLEKGRTYPIFRIAGEVRSVGRLVN